ncbi:unnamed protein product [Mytilus edulis]|uniref:Uncharacterized protein n=1 Tax=Mytilus edulis TaxID=6550 RepID=A0A8S3TEF1_MYTED|nr:unnamed protein product [Mytilus edulis]
MILNNACADQEIETIKILSKYFYTLDMNEAMIKACTSTSSGYEEFIFQQKDFNNNQSVACLNLLWKEINKIDHDKIDIRTIVSTVCKEKEVSNNVMTWILLNFPLDKIPINEVLTTCCQQSKIQHVKYIFQEVDNEKLDIRKAFVRTCLAAPDYVFQKLHDKDYCVSLVVNQIVEKKKFNLILYFRQAGYYRHVDMQNLLNEACGHGHVKLVIWILGNVEHKELDITSAFHAACDSIVNDYKHIFQDNEERVNHVMCVALLWHYIHDINMFEIDTVLKPMTESQSDTSVLDYKHISIDKLKTWLLYIKKINQRICQSDNALLSSEENINLKRQVNDRQCCEQDPQENNELNSSIDNDDCLSPTKRLCLEKEQT